MAWHPELRCPPYVHDLERRAYSVGYDRGYALKPKAHPLESRWPNAYARGYWDGFADNPKPDANP